MKLIRKLIAFAVSLDGNFVQFGLGHDSDLSVEGDAEIEFSFFLINFYVEIFISFFARKNIFFFVLTLRS